METTGKDLGIVSPGDDVDVTAGPFMDTAAIMKSLDLVITTDTAVAHLAGALGIPVWVILSYQPEWRWQMSGETSPWYPSMKLFRQPALGDWDSVFEQVVHELHKLDRAIQSRPSSSRVITTIGTNSLVRARHGLMLANRNDRFIGRSVLDYGEFSQPEVDLFTQLVTEGSTVVEAGANIGTHTLPYAQTVGNHGRVYAFEPQRVVFQMLCGNISLNGLTNVICKQEALGESPGTITVPSLDYAGVGNFGGISLGKWSKGEPVAVTTIDSLGLSECHFLKVDVEGMELDVLRGAEKTITRLHPKLYIENDREENSRALLQYLMDLDYQLFWHTPHMYQASNYFQNVTNQFQNIVSINVLGFHASENMKVTGFRRITSADCTWRTQ